MYPDLKDKVALVTGGGGGTGKTICHKLAEEGCKVTVFGINQERVVSTAEELLDEYGAEAGYPYVGDVSSKTDVHNAVQRTVQHRGKIDLLVNNAGVSEIDAVVDIKEHHWDRIFEVNTKGVFLCTQAVARQMIKQGRNTDELDAPAGHIVNIISESVQSPHTLCGAYVASKAAAAHFCRTAARELIKEGIRINNIHPGIIEDTYLTNYLQEKFRGWYDMTPEQIHQMCISKIPLKRFCTKTEVANLVTFLSSEMSSYIVGEDIFVSGGQNISG